MEKRLEGNIPSISAAQQEMLQTKHALIVGCGGIGCYLVEYLTRLGVGKITIIDNDTFEVSNLNRQLYAAADTLGKSKVVVAKERANAINPNVQVDFWLSRLRSATVASALTGKDIVLDALDQTEDRLMLERACAEAGLYLIHGAVALWQVQVMSVSPGSGSLTAFYENNAVSSTASTLSFVPAACASVQTAQAIQVLCGETPSLKDRVLLWDLKQMKMDMVSPGERILAEREIEVVISKYNKKDTYSIPERTTVRQLLQVLSLEGEALYVMRNGQYVMPEDFDRPIIEEGDLLEFRKSAAFGG